ncbi:MAG: S8 family serine peptidase [bacterium]
MIKDDGGQALNPRLRAFLPIIPIVLILIASCSQTGPSTPDRGLSTNLSAPMKAQAYEAAVRNLVSTDAVRKGQISLKLVEGEKIDPILEKWNLSLIDYKEFIDFYHLALPKGADLASTLTAMREDKRIAVVEPIYCTHMSQLRVEPADPRFTAGEQWYMENIDVPEAWVIEPGDPSVNNPPAVSDVVVAILDTGIDYHHEDLETFGGTSYADNYKMLPGYDYINGDNDPGDDNGHGTMIAGLIGGKTDNYIGIASVSWNARLMPIKVLDQLGNGDSVSTVDGIQCAVQQFLDSKNKLDPFDDDFDNETTFFNNPENAKLIINMSYTYTALNATGPSQMELTAVQYAINKGALLVAAAGDEARPLDNGDTSVYPASYPGVIAVGATDQANALYASTNSLPLGTDPAVSLFVVAPGVDILSTYPKKFSSAGYAVGTGSSFSAAITSGVLALIWSQFPYLTPYEAKETLIWGCDSDLIGIDGPDLVSGHGLINAFKSLKRNFTPNPTNEPVIVRAFTNPILHGDVIFIIRSHYHFLAATETTAMNGGYPVRYDIGWDFDLDGVIDSPLPIINVLNTNYWRHEILFTQIDSATYVGRIHLPQDIVDNKPMGQLVIQFTGVPYNWTQNGPLPPTVSAYTTIQIDEFNYDLPG